MQKIKLALSFSISIAAMTLGAGTALGQARTDWPSVNHDNSSVRYSPLTQVNPANVKNLKQEWIYHLKPADFTGRLRYTGASIGYQLASLIAGGPAPLIAAALFATYRSWVAISVYISICAVISVVAAAFMRDYTGQDISEEYAFDKA